MRRWPASTPCRAKLAAGADHVLVVPDHGRHGIAHAGARPVQPVDARAGQALRFRLLHMFAVAMAPAGFIAVLAGWITTEIGRPAVHGVWFAAHGRSASPLAAPAVASSLIAFIIVYFAVFTAGVIYLLRLMAAPPHPGEEGPSHEVPIRTPASRPPRARLTEEEPPDDRNRPPDRLGLHHRLCRVRLCRDGRLRSRPRHPVSALPGETRIATSS